jgi:hypothetical protein
MRAKALALALLCSLNGGLHAAEDRIVVQHVNSIGARPCGPGLVSMTFEHSRASLGSVDAVVKLTKGTKSVAVRVSDSREYVGFRCEKSSTGEPVLVVQAFCGGSGCHDLDNFFIVSVKTLKVLLQPRSPDDLNREEAKSILGHDVPPMSQVYSIYIGADGQER